MIGLEVCDSKLYCYGDKHEKKLLLEREPIWSVEIRDIVLVAENTTDEGPYCDDYFLIFATKSCIYRSTFYAEGLDAVFETLDERFSMPLRLQFSSSTHWASRVIWPAHLEGSDYFQFTEVKPNNIVSTMHKALLGPQLEYRVAEPIRKFLNEAGCMGN